MLIDNNIVENESIVNSNFKEKLLKMREELTKKENIINSKKIAEENKLKLNKDRAISDLFKIMKSAGVDFDNLSSIQKFLLDLETRDPDLKELFEEAVNNIIEDKNNLNINNTNENIQKTI